MKGWAKLKEMEREREKERVIDVLTPKEKNGFSKTHQKMEGSECWK